ncbi:hypothetical protein CR513_21047, partial [Mucuna pruriens]
MNSEMERFSITTFHRLKPDLDIARFQRIRLKEYIRNLFARITIEVDKKKLATMALRYCHHMTMLDCSPIEDLRSSIRKKIQRSEAPYF